MYNPRNNGNIPNARKLRKGMTKEERHLWFDFLRYCVPPILKAWALRWCGITIQTFKQILKEYVSIF